MHRSKLGVDRLHSFAMKGIIHVQGTIGKHTLVLAPDASKSDGSLVDWPAHVILRTTA